MRLPSEASITPYVLQEGVERYDRLVARLRFDGADTESKQANSVAPIDSETKEGVEPDAWKEELKLVTFKLEAQLEEARQATDAARSECAAEFARNLEAERERISNFWNKFERERAHYFVTAESEVVKLALAIAAHILQREARLDPMLLKGVVRVELERIRDAGAVKMRVPASEIEMWTKTLEGIRDTSLQLIGDERLSSGDCVLESNAGCMNLGVASQLNEIERGFFDLLEKKPA